MDCWLEDQQEIFCSRQWNLTIGTTTLKILPKEGNLTKRYLQFVWPSQLIQCVYLLPDISSDRSPRWRWIVARGHSARLGIISPKEFRGRFSFTPILLENNSEFSYTTVTTFVKFLSNSISWIHSPVFLTSEGPYEALSSFHRPQEIWLIRTLEA